MTKTYSAKPSDITRKWYLVDASDTTLGRLSTAIATKLTGKDKPIYTPHIDCGDYVVVINADKLKVTGGKEDKKVYYRHTGYPGGIKQETLGEKDPVKVIEHSVRGMLPVNKLRDGRLKRLNVYVGSEHAHSGQKPEQLSLKENK